MAVVSTVGGKIEVPEFTKEEEAGMSANEKAETEKVSWRYSENYSTT